jgi:hypothetical protein
MDFPFTACRTIPTASWGCPHCAIGDMAPIARLSVSASPSGPTSFCFGKIATTWRTGLGCCTSAAGGSCTFAVCGGGGTGACDFAVCAFGFTSSCSSPNRMFCAAERRMFSVRDNAAVACDSPTDLRTSTAVACACFSCWCFLLLSTTIALSVVSNFCSNFSDSAEAED